jgi:alkanesulfonate monooxygenase SsuD/methylene tetrahydromethanopterin reductase-like flavin-dependent oxidoreductase (luciferase family)
MKSSAPLRYSIFSVNDHHPRLARTVPQLYAQVMQQCELSETLGYDTFFCAEHHFHEYGVVPDPAVMLSALAQRTRRIRLGTATSILTFHDPRRIAETYAVLAREAAYHVGRQANRIFTVPYASCKDFDDIGSMLAEYRKGRAEAGLEADDDDHVFTLHTYVAKSDKEAKAQCKEAYDRYVDTRLYAKKHVYEDIIANGICLFGSLDTVAEKMCRLHEMGIRHVATMHNFGALAPDLVERSMTMFAREVMPMVSSRIAVREGVETN